MVLIVFLAIGALFLSVFYNPEFSIAQFHLVMVGSKIYEGKLLYLSVYDYLAPIPVYLNSFLPILSESNLLYSKIISCILILLNSLYFNSIIDLAPNLTAK